MEMDCIPAGMELFPAADEEQWEFIKRVIDDCDYYLLIIGGRYGSTTSDGISYTEKEYDYAVENGIKVIALIHENPDEITVGKSDIEPELREKLQLFREKVSGNRLVKFWNKAEELPGLVALSMSKTIKMFPALGWVRASAASSEELLGELNELRKENSTLKSKISTLEIPEQLQVEGIAGLDEMFTINGTYYGSNNTKYNWSSKLTWREIFSHISPYLIQHPNHDYVKEQLKATLIKRDNISIQSNSLDDQDFQTVSLQLKALGLININYSKTTAGGMSLFWRLTPKGEKLMMQERTVPTIVPKIT